MNYNDLHSFAFKEPTLIEFIRGRDLTSQECWEWKGPRMGGHTSSGDYGSIGVFGERWYTHRLMYALFKGALTEGKEIDHLCRNRLCANPNHLEEVEPKENWRRGQSVTRAKSLQTHCKRGHEFTAENTYFVSKRSGPRRYCRTCTLAQQKATYLAKVGERTYREYESPRRAKRMRFD